MTLPPEKNEGYGPHIQIRPAGYQSGRCEAIFSPVQKLSGFPSSQAFEKHTITSETRSASFTRYRDIRQGRILQMSSHHAHLYKL